MSKLKVSIYVTECECYVLINNSRAVFSVRQVEMDGKNYLKLNQNYFSFKKNLVRLVAV